MLLVFTSSFSFAEEIVHEFLGDVAELVVVLAGKVGDGLFGEVPEFVPGGRVLTQRVSDPPLTSCLDLLGHVAELVAGTVLLE